MGLGYASSDGSSSLDGVSDPVWGGVFRVQPLGKQGFQYWSSRFRD